MPPIASINTGEASSRGNVRGIALVFLRLGCISFGGPVAHLGYLREEFVSRRQWLDDDAYTDFIALCQFLPGATSSQMVFALGMLRAGLFGGLLASFCFTLPSAVLMILFAYSVSAAGSLHHAGWLHGLKLAAVAVVAQAVWGMGRTLCPDAARIGTALAAAIITLLIPGSVGQIGILIAGGVIGWFLYRGRPVSAFAATGKIPSALVQNHLLAGGLLIFFGFLLLILPLIASVGGLWFKLFNGFYHAGSLVFGGGHVVLPLLRTQLVGQGWINNDAFLAGYGAVQAMPGPLFTFAAYLGTAITGGSHAWIGGVWCLLALFLPSWLLVAGTLPYWDQLRDKRWARASMFGINAVVVGILLAALYNPLWKESISSLLDILIAIGIFALLSPMKVPPWIVVLLAAAIGQLLL